MQSQRLVINRVVEEHEEINKMAHGVVDDSLR